VFQIAIEDQPNGSELHEKLLGLRLNNLQLLQTVQFQDSSNLARRRARSLIIAMMKQMCFSCRRSINLLNSREFLSKSTKLLA